MIIFLHLAPRWASAAAIHVVFSITLSKSFTANNLVDAFYFFLCLRKEVNSFSKLCLQPLPVNPLVLWPAVKFSHVTVLWLGDG